MHMQVVDTIPWRTMETNSVAIRIIGHHVVHELRPYLPHVVYQVDVSELVLGISNHFVLLRVKPRP